MASNTRRIKLFDFLVKFTVPTRPRDFLINACSRVPSSRSVRNKLGCVANRGILNIRMPVYADAHRSKQRTIKLYARQA